MFFSSQRFNLISHVNLLPTIACGVASNVATRLWPVSQIKQRAPRRTGETRKNEPGALYVCVCLCRCLHASVRLRGPES